MTKKGDRRARKSPLKSTGAIGSMGGIGAGLTMLIANPRNPEGYVVLASALLSLWGRWRAGQPLGF